MLQDSERSKSVGNNSINTSWKKLTKEPLLSDKGIDSCLKLFFFNFSYLFWMKKYWMKMVIWIKCFSLGCVYLLLDFRFDIFKLRKLEAMLLNGFLFVFDFFFWFNFNLWRGFGFIGLKHFQDSFSLFSQLNVFFSIRIANDVLNGSWWTEFSWNNYRFGTP